MTDEVAEVEVLDQPDQPLLDQFMGADDRGAFMDPQYGRVSTGTPPSISYVNESGVPQDVIDLWIRDGGYQEVASVIEKWSQSLNIADNVPTLDMFNRSRRIEREVHPHAMMARCAWVVENDDVLSTLADVIEGLMWQKCRFELIENDEEDFWNQWAATVNLDRMLREMGREIFKCSQVYVGLWWGQKIYKVRDSPIDSELQRLEFEKQQRDYTKKTAERDALIEANKDTEGFIEPPPIPEPVDPSKGRGNRSRKKTYPVEIPTAMTVFDPTKIIPVGTLMFGRERFAYVADRAENEAFTEVMAGNIADSTVLQLIERKYTPTAQDLVACADLGVDSNNLWLFKQDAIFRYTLTKSDYERYAPVRLKPALPLVEMKDHLRNSDRAMLIGNTNFIVVITKGTDKYPAKAAEIENLQQQARIIARLPVLIGDHRLNVEIVSPNLDNTLTESRYQLLDSRLVFVALRTFTPIVQGANSAGSGVSEMGLLVSKGLQSRRHMILRSIEENVFQLVMDRNEGVLDEFPTLEFSPKRISLDFQKDLVAAIMKLRDRGDISRETSLEELDYDQDVEVLRRAREKSQYDDTFNSGTPFASPLTQPFAPQQPGQPPPHPAAVPPAPAPGGNVGPNGQPRTEGGRPSGVVEKRARKTPGS